MPRRRCGSAGCAAVVGGHGRVPRGAPAAPAAGIAARPQPRGRGPALRPQQVGRARASAAAAAGRDGPGDRARAALPAGAVAWPPVLRGGIAAPPGPGSS